MDDKSDGMLYLVDSGAQISILPRAVYDQYYDRTTTPLSESDMTIKAGNDTRVECHGIAHCLIPLPSNTARTGSSMSGSARTTSRR